MHPTSPETPPETPEVGESSTSNTAPDLTAIDRRSLLKLIHATMPLPTREETGADGSLVFVGGDPGEVIIRVARSQISVSVFGIVWEGSHTPVVSPKPLLSLNWRLMPAARLTPLLHDMIEAAQQIRLATFHKCEHCGETKPPEWMHGKNCCQSCAEQHLGIVH